MNVVILYQFYLPYSLPRAADWPSAPIRIKNPGHISDVLPRHYNQELFPNYMDKVLSTMEVGFSYPYNPDIVFTTSVKDYCRDRVEVRLYSEVSSAEEACREETKDMLLSFAMSDCNFFLNHCRVAARSPFVKGIESYYRGEHGQLSIVNPYTATWFDADADKQLPVYSHGGEPVNASAFSNAIISPVTGEVTMAVLLQSLASGTSPDLASSLLVDSEEYLRSMRLREGVIALGSALEVAYSEYLIRKGQKDEKLRKILTPPRGISFAEWRYHLAPNHVSARSFKGEDSAAFTFAENAYKTRNSLAHESSLSYTDAAGNRVDVDQKLAWAFFEACNKAVTWIQGL